MLNLNRSLFNQIEYAATKVTGPNEVEELKELYE